MVGVYSPTLSHWLAWTFYYHEPLASVDFLWSSRQSVEKVGSVFNTNCSTVDDDTPNSTAPYWTVLVVFIVELICTVLKTVLEFTL